jgi:hypothetical protein
MRRMRSDLLSRPRMRRSRCHLVWRNPVMPLLKCHHGGLNCIVPSSAIVAVGSSNTPTTPWPGLLALEARSLWSLDWHHKPTLVFSAHFVLTLAHPGRTSWLVTTQIAPSQARLTLKFFVDELSKKSLQHVDTNIISILLSPEPGCHRAVVGSCPSLSSAPPPMA